MKIYFGASVSVDRSRLPLYQEIVAVIKKLGHEVLSEQVVDPSLKIGEDLPANELFQREAKTVEQADLMVAEVSVPSWGTAFLMEHALEQGVPVLALYHHRDADNGHLPMMIKGHPELYVDYYEQANIKAVIGRNFKYFTQQQKNRGKLIVIDGADGSGKATQQELLGGYLNQQRVPNQRISFPRYKTSFHGKHVGRFLTGEFGQAVNPYLSSLAFALDRLTARDELMEWLAEGKVVIADRYVTASMAHQASKLPKDKRDEFINWIYEMEYKEHHLPKEDLVLFLDVPTEISKKLLEKFSKENGVDQDQAEQDYKHQQASLDMYRQLVKKFPHWHRINCTAKGELLSKEKIHQKIIALLKKEKVIA